jgi:hypothetical protein
LYLIDGKWSQNIKGGSQVDIFGIKVFVITFDQESPMVTQSFEGISGLVGHKMSGKAMSPF